MIFECWVVVGRVGVVMGVGWVLLWVWGGCCYGCGMGAIMGGKVGEGSGGIPLAPSSISLPTPR